VGKYITERAIGPSGLWIRGLRGSLGANKNKIRCTTPLDDARGIKAPSYWGTASLPKDGVEVLQQCVSGGEARAEAVQNGRKYETSELEMVGTGLLVQDGGPEGFPGDGVDRCLGGDLGPRRRILPPDAGLLDVPVFWDRIRGEFLPVQSSDVRMGQIDVLFQQVDGSGQTLVEAGVCNPSMVARRRLLCSVPLGAASVPGEGRSPGSGVGGTGSDPRANERLLGQANAATCDLRVPDRLSSGDCLWGTRTDHHSGSEETGPGSSADSSGRVGGLPCVGSIHGQGLRQGGFCSDGFLAGKGLVSRVLLGDRLQESSSLGLGSEGYLDLRGLSGGRILPDSGTTGPQWSHDLAGVRNGITTLGRQHDWMGSGHLDGRDSDGANRAGKRALEIPYDAEAHQRPRAACSAAGIVRFRTISHWSSDQATGRLGYGQRGGVEFQGFSAIQGAQSGYQADLGVGSGGSLLPFASGVCEYQGQRLGGCSEQGIRHVRLGDFGCGLEIDRPALGASYMGQVRGSNKHPVLEVHSKILSAGVSLAGLLDSGLERREQLRVPTGDSAASGTEEGGAVGRRGDIYCSELPCQMVAHAGKDKDRATGVATAISGVSARPIRACRAMEASRNSTTESLPGRESSGEQSSNTESSVEEEDSEIVRIIDENVNGSEFLCVFAGYRKPYWVKREGMFKDGVCTCQGVWKDYQRFKSTLDSSVPGHVPTVGFSNGVRLQRHTLDKFNVTDAELDDHVKWLVSRAREKTTAAAYAKIWNQVVVPHCRWRNLNPWSLESGDLANLLGWHEMQGKAGEVERLFNAVRVAYASRDLMLPVSPLAREIVRGAARVHAEEKGDVSREGFPISKFRDLCDQPELYQRHRTGVRDRAIIAIGLRCMRRPVELTKLRCKHVCWSVPSDLSWETPPGAPISYSGRWLKFYIRSQKNDKGAKGQWIFIEPTWSAYCPVRLLLSYCEEFGVVLGPGIQGDQPLFTSLTESGRPVSAGAINSLVKKSAKMLGIENITGHSLRIGGATAAAAAGLGLDIIRSIGGWFSDAVFGYIRAAAAPAMRVSSRMGF
jgi:integrase